MKPDLESEHTCAYCMCIRSASRGVMYVATVVGDDDEALVEATYIAGMDAIDTPLRELAKKCPELKQFQHKTKGLVN